MKRNPFYAWAALIVAMLAVISCGDDDNERIINPIAGFTFETDEENLQVIHFTNTSRHGTSYAWDFGDNSEIITEENPVHSFTEGGTFSVRLRVVGKTPDVFDEIVKEVFAMGPVIEGEEMIQGGHMEKEDEDKWTIFALYESVPFYEFGNTDLTPSKGEGGSLKLWDNELICEGVIWQAVELDAEKQYIFSAVVKGSGMTNGWFQIFIGEEEPVEGEDYENAEMLKGLNSWEGCGHIAFDDEIGILGCEGDLPPSSIFSVPSSGTYYFVIKTGVWEGSYGEGIAIDEISLKELISQ